MWTIIWKQYGTEEIISILGYWKLRLAPLGEWNEWQKISDNQFVDSVIARLRAADALVTAVREESPLSASVREAIAEYEGEE